MPDGLEGLRQKIARCELELSKRQADCISYPQGSLPLVGFPIEEVIAFMVKCPLHGDRFTGHGDGIYVCKWMREKMYKDIVNLSPSLFVLTKYPLQRAQQYRKTHIASFPPDLWLDRVEKEEQVDNVLKIFLRLTDGIKVQVEEHHFSKPFGNAQATSQESAEEAPFQRTRQERERRSTWLMETLRVFASILSNRGLIVRVPCLG